MFNNASSTESSLFMCECKDANPHSPEFHFNTWKQHGECSSPSIRAHTPPPLSPRCTSAVWLSELLFAVKLVQIPVSNKLESRESLCKHQQKLMLAFSHILANTSVIFLSNALTSCVCDRVPVIVLRRLDRLMCLDLAAADIMSDELRHFSKQASRLSLCRDVTVPVDSNNKQQSGNLNMKHPADTKSMEENILRFLPDTEHSAPYRQRRAMHQSAALKLHWKVLMNMLIWWDPSYLNLSYTLIV